MDAFTYILVLKYMDAFTYILVLIMNGCIYIYLSPEDDQIILIETSSCNLQFFSELITTQLRDFHMVSPQVAFPYLHISWFL